MTLQDHQSKAKSKIEKSNKIILYHGLGSGKTLTGLASRKGNTEVIAPASLRTNISDTINKFKLSGKNLKIRSFEGAAKSDLSGDTLIVDEAHRLGRADSRRSQKIRKDSHKFNRVILMTGSPIRNSPSEIAPLANMVGISEKEIPLTEKNFNDMYIEKEYDKIGLWDRIKGVKPGFTSDIKNKDKLRAAFKGKIDRYSPSQSNFPSRKDIHHDITMSDSQYDLYKKLTSASNSDVVQKVDSQKPMTLDEKRRANSFLSAARILSNSETSFGGSNVTPKIKAVADFIHKNKSKQVVYSSYLDGGIRSVEKRMKGLGDKAFVFDGSMSDRNKKDVVSKFNKSSKATLLISGAGAEGLDLKGVRHLHILEPHWNEAKTDQVAGRAIRYKSHDHLPKRDRNVTIHSYRSIVKEPNKTILDKILMRKPKRQGSADEYLYGLGKTKKELNDKFMKIISE